MLFQGAFAFFLTINQNDVYSPDVNFSIDGHGFGDYAMRDSLHVRDFDRRGRDLTIQERIQQLVENPLHAVRFHLAKVRSVHQRLLNGMQKVLGGPCTESVKGNEGQRGGS